MATKQELEVLVRAGLNPLTHDVVNGEVIDYGVPIRSNVELQQIFGVPAQAPAQPISTDDGAIRAGLRSAKRAVIPTAAGLGTTGAILAASAAGGPVTFLPTVGAIGAGMGASALTSYLRDKYFPPSQEEAQQIYQDIERHPVATVVGETLPSLAVLRPSVTGLRSAGQGLSRVLSTPSALTIPEKAALANIGAGAAINAAGEAVPDYLMRGEVDPKRVLTAAAIGAVDARPTALGRRLGFPDVGPAVVRKPDAQLTELDYSTPAKVNEATSPVGFTLREPSVKVGEAKIDPRAAQRVAEQVGQARVGLKPDTSPKTFDDKAAEITMGRAVEPEEIKGLESKVIDRVFAGTPDTAELVKKFDKEDAVARPDVEPVGQKTEAEMLQDEFDAEEVGRVRYQRASDQEAKLGQLLDELGVPKNLRGNMTYKRFYDEVARKRGVTVKEGEAEGGAGLAHMRERVAEINPNSPKIGLDTPLHETAHIFVEDLKEVGTPAEKRLVAEGEEIFGGDEQLVNAVGLGGVREHYSNKAKNWIKSFWSHIKFRVGKASDADLERLLSRKLLIEPPLEQRTGVGLEGLTGGTRASAESEVKQGMPTIMSREGLPQPMMELDRASSAFVERYEAWLVNVKGKTPEEAKAIVAQARANTRRQGASEIAQGEQPAFELTANKLLRNNAVLKLQPGKDGRYDGSTLLGRLRNQLPPVEKDMLEQAGLEKFLSGQKRTTQEVEQWLADNGPKVEVHEYGMEGKVSKVREEYDRMTHEWFDNQPQYVKNIINREYPSMPDTSGLSNSLKTRFPNELLNAIKYAKLKRSVEFEMPEARTGPRATSAYNQVSPKSPQTHPVQRVDVVLPLSEAGQIIHKRGERADMLWSPDQLHEQLPNTLGWAAIQYETLPSGEKVAHLFEVQSRWGQELREQKKLAGEKGFTKAEKSLDHPLLRDYNRLILKAAISQARKEGATKIAISGYKEAALTEGWDGEYKGPYKSQQEAQSQAEQFKKSTDDNWVVETPELTGRQDEWFISKHAGGGRLNYDKILPKIAEELTGDKGSMVSFGEHKNSLGQYADLERHIGDFDTLQEAEHAVRNYRSDNAPAIITQKPEGWFSIDIVPERHRKNLIFQNPDGTPKTDVTARVYDISGVSRTLATEPFSLAGKRFQRVSPLAQGAAKGNTIIPPEYQPTVIDTNPTATKGGFLRMFQPMIDAVKEKNPHLADRLAERDRLQTRLQGRYVNQYQNLQKKAGYTTKEWDNAYRWGHAKWNEYETDIQLTPREQQLYADFFQQQIRQVREDQLDDGPKVARNTGTGHKKWGAGSLNEDYMYSMMDKEVAQVMREGLNDPRREQYINQLAEWWVKQNNYKKNPNYDIAQAKKEANDLAIALTGERREDSVQKFNALRRAEGLGLPPEMIERDGFAAFQHYGARAARDLAWYRAIESDKEARSALNVPDQFGKKDDNIPELKKFSGQPEVQDILKYISHEKPRIEAALNAMNRMTVSTFLGPFSVARDILSSYVQMLGYMKVTQIPEFVKAYAHLSNGWTKSFQLGVNRNNVLDLEFGPSSVSRTISMFDKLSSMISTLQTRNIGEQFSRANTFTIGQLLGHSMFGHALAGVQSGKIDQEAMKFLQLFGKGWKRSVGDVIRSGHMTADEIDEIGAAFTERIQGTYSERGLPSFALQGMTSPIFSLARWSIERSNMVYKDLAVPLMRNDPGAYRKLLLYTVGAVLGGEAIAGIGEILNNRKSYEPRLKEISDSRYASADDLTQTLIYLLQMSGTAGIMSDFARSAALISRGESPQGFSYPLSDWASNVVLDNVRSATYAISEGQPALDTTVKMTGDILRQTSQLYRIVYNNYAKEESQRKDIARDLRVFRRQTGRPVPPFSAENQGAGLINADVREFKRGTDVTKVQQQLRPILRRIIDENKGDPVGLERALRGLKTMPISEIPSPDSDPRQFTEFFDFLRQTAGNEYAEKALRYYLQRRVANEAKQQLIP